MNEDAINPENTFNGQVTLTRPDLSTTTVESARAIDIPLPASLGTYVIEARGTSGDLCDRAEIEVVADPPSCTINDDNIGQIVTALGDVDVTSTPQCGIYDVYVKDDAGKYVGKVTVDLTTGRDWGGLKKLVRLPQESIEGAISVFHYPLGIGNLPGNTTGDATLYVPRTSFDDQVRVCPGADDVDEVTWSCAGGVTLSEGVTGQYTVAKVELAGDLYWEIDGITGTGGLSGGDAGMQTPTSFSITPNASAVSTTQEVNVTFVSSTEYVSGSQIAIDFNTGGNFTLANCATADLDADNDGLNDGAAVAQTNGGSNADRFLYTLTSSTTQATTTGINLCIAVTSPDTPGNYQADLIDSVGQYGSAYYYVGSENQLNVIGTVDPVLTLVIRDENDTADLANIGNSAVGPNLCDLGNLSDAGIQTCSYRLKVGTNAANGYTITMTTDGSLRKGTDFISNIGNGTLVTANSEGYGIEFNGGSYDSDGVGVDYAPVACVEEGDFSTDDTPLATAIMTGISSNLVTCGGPNSPDLIDTTNTSLVTHRAEADSGTPAGTPACRQAGILI